ncbi:MAG: dephospho-CoA kinase [Solirubrobacterales bacterium]
MTVGLTGGVAAGKSEALRAFANLGAATVSADAIVHDLLDREPMLSRLRERWGDEIENDGIADRAAIGSRVFNQPDELNWLESQVHPLVHGEIGKWFAAMDPATKVAVVEVPLLFEGEMSKDFDVTVAIVADEEVRAERARSRGHAGVEGREGRQLSQDEKAARADHIVTNDSTPEELQKRLGELLERLTG